MSSKKPKSVARQYAARGACVCVVGRREALVEKVAVECRNAHKSARWHDMLGVAGDFTDVQELGIPSKKVRSWVSMQKEKKQH